jgi:hypothetical protein
MNTDGAGNPKSEIRNESEFPKSECSKPLANHSQKGSNLQLSTCNDFHPRERNNYGG